MKRFKIVGGPDPKNIRVISPNGESLMGVTKITIKPITLEVAAVTAVIEVVAELGLDMKEE